MSGGWGGGESPGVNVHAVTCPYCGESVEVAVEADVRGEMVWDCEVCCRPWKVTVRGAGGDRGVEVHTLED